MNAVTIDEAKSDLDSLITQVIVNVEPTIITTDSGEKIVLLSLDEFNAWQETLYLLSTPANRDHLQTSIKEAELGQTMEQELVDA